jgi:dihydrofolate reductase
MAKVFVIMATSLDGYVAKRDISKQHPFGVGGERVYDWQFAKKTETDSGIVKELMERTGAVIAGGRTYALAIDDAWGGINPFSAPVFVLSKTVPDKVAKGFTFVTDGIESALAKAKATAGDKDVWVMGGANVAQQNIKAGLVDELHLHIVPVLFGDGIRLWDNIGTKQIELENAGVVQTPGATHLTSKFVR